MPPRCGQPAELADREMICKFNKVKPPKFEGGSGPLVYEEWLQEMENLFEIMKCLERFKVRLASYQFEWDVEYWWGTVELRVSEAPLTWDQPKNLVDANYSKDVKRAKEQEFLHHK